MVLAHGLPVVIEVVAESMSPAIERGAKVKVEPAPDDLHPGDIVLVLTDDGAELAAPPGDAPLLQGREPLRHSPGGRAEVDLRHLPARGGRRPRHLVPAHAVAPAADAGAARRAASLARFQRRRRAAALYAVGHRMTESLRLGDRRADPPPGPRLPRDRPQGRRVNAMQITRRRSSTFAAPLLLIALAALLASRAALAKNPEEPETAPGRQRHHLPEPRPRSRLLVRHRGQQHRPVQPAVFRPLPGANSFGPRSGRRAAEPRSRDCSRSSPATGRPARRRSSSTARWRSAAGSRARSASPGSPTWTSCATRRCRTTPTWRASRSTSSSRSSDVWEVNDRPRADLLRSPMSRATGWRFGSARCRPPICSTSTPPAPTATCSS